MAQTAKMVMAIHGRINIDVSEHGAEQEILLSLADGVKVMLTVLPRQVGISVKGYGTRPFSDGDIAMLDLAEMEFGGDPVLFAWDNIRQLSWSNRIGFKWAKEDRRL